MTWYLLVEVSSTAQVKIYSFRYNCLNGERAMQPWQVEEHMLCEGGMEEERDVEALLLAQ